MWEGDCQKAGDLVARGALFVTFFIDKKVTMLRPATAQPCATAQQPSSRSLNSPERSTCFWRSVSLSRLIRFQILLLEHDFFPRVLLCPEPNRPFGSVNKERQVLSLFEMNSFLKKC